MSNKILDWAWEQPLKAGPKLALMALADESNDQGMVFLSRQNLAMKVAGIDDSNASEEEIDNATRVLRRHIKVLMDGNYMMTGRRQRKWSRGRAIDVIFLNVRGVKGVKLYDSEDDVPGELPNPFLMDQPVDNSSDVLGDNLSGKNVSPSQDLEDNLSGKTSRASFTGQNSTSYRTKMDVLPDNSGHEKAAALKGTRARLTLNNPSIPQSVSQSSGPVDNFSTRTDRPTQAPEENSPIVHGVKLSALRSMLEAKSGSSLASISDAELGRMVTIVVSRATAPVRSPLAFAITAIGSELDELHSLAVSLLAAEAAQKAPKGFCSTHTREFTGSCPLCAKEASGALRLEPTSAPEPQGLDRAAGLAFREKIRARRLAQNA